MTEPKAGGPAFPPHPGSQTHGMSLRDYFAGQALAFLGNVLDTTEGHPLDAGVAASAYQLADAMLTARTQSQEPSR